MIIQYALIALMLSVLVHFLANRNSTGVRAWKRVALLILVALGVLAVLNPEASNRLAHLVGVGRGADMLLYLTVVAFVFVSLNVYLKFRDLESRLTEVGRAVALLEAELNALMRAPAEADGVQ
jgi:hypothetical protein